MPGKRVDSLLSCVDHLAEQDAPHTPSAIKAQAEAHADPNHGLKNRRGSTFVSSMKRKEGSADWQGSRFRTGDAEGKLKVDESAMRHFALHGDAALGVNRTHNSNVLDALTAADLAALANAAAIKARADPNHGMAKRRGSTLASAAKRDAASPDWQGSRFNSTDDPRLHKKMDEETDAARDSWIGTRKEDPRDRLRLEIQGDRETKGHWLKHGDHSLDRPNGSSKKAAADPLAAAVDHTTTRTPAPLVVKAEAMKAAADPNHGLSHRRGSTVATTLKRAALSPDWQGSRHSASSLAVPQAATLLNKPPQIKPAGPPHKPGGRARSASPNATPSPSKGGPKSTAAKRAESPREFMSYTDTPRTAAGRETAMRIASAHAKPFEMESVITPIAEDADSTTIPPAQKDPERYRPGAGSVPATIDSFDAAPPLENQQSRPSRSLGATVSAPAEPTRPGSIPSPTPPKALHEGPGGAQYELGWKVGWEAGWKAALEAAKTSNDNAAKPPLPPLPPPPPPLSVATRNADPPRLPSPSARVVSKSPRRSSPRGASSASVSIGAPPRQQAQLIAQLRLDLETETPSTPSRSAYDRYLNPGGHPGASAGKMPHDTHRTQSARF